MLNSSGWEFHHDRSENICLNAVCLPPKTSTPQFVCPPKLLHYIFCAHQQRIHVPENEFNKSQWQTFTFTLFASCIMSNKSCATVLLCCLYLYLSKAFIKFKGFNCLNLLESLKLRLVNFANDARIVWCQLNRLVRELK